jgi:hypothetical protein
MDSEQSTAATYDDLKPLMDQALDMAQFYRQRIIDYLCDNISSYPEYSSNSGSDLTPTSNNYTQGLNVDDVYMDKRYAAFLAGANIKC